MYELYVLAEQEETLLYRRVNGFRLNISPATCVTTALYVEDDCSLGFDTEWPDTKLRVITCHTSALLVEAVGSSETLEPIHQTARSRFEATNDVCVCVCVVAGLDHSHAALRTYTARVFTPAYRLMLWSLTTGTSVLMCVGSH